MKRSSAMAMTLLALTLAACTMAGADEQAAASRTGSRAGPPAARVVGQPQMCIPIVQIRESRIRDDFTIDFISTGRQTWRVTLPSRCPGLKAENSFTYETSLTQLCSNDIIYVLYNYGGRLQRGPGCGLSQFVPVELEK